MIPPHQLAAMRDPISGFPVYTDAQIRSMCRIQADSDHRLNKFKKNAVNHSGYRIELLKHEDDRLKYGIYNDDAATWPCGRLVLGNCSVGGDEGIAIGYVFVDKKYRNNGQKLGTKLVQFVLDTCDEIELDCFLRVDPVEFDSFGNFKLCDQPENGLDHKGLVEWYRRMGFEYPGDGSTVRMGRRHKGNQQART